MSTAVVSDTLDLRRFAALEFGALEENGFFAPGEAVYLQDGILHDLANGARRRFTADEFERMADLGFFDDDDRIELIDGELYTMARVKEPHTSSINRLNMLLVPPLVGLASVIVQNPVRLGIADEPQPDVTIARYREDGYALGHPRPVDVFFVIEVMHSSVHRDRVKKLPRYAEAGIPEVWLVALERDDLEVCRAPVGERYDDRRIYTRGQRIAPTAFPDVLLPVDAILSWVPPT